MTTTTRALARTLCIAALVAALASPAVVQAADEPLGGLYGLSVGAGLVKAPHQSSTLGFLARADVGTYQILSFLPTFEYWSQSTEAEGTKVSRHDLTAGLDLRVRFSQGPTRPYAGGGVAFHFLNLKTNSGGSLAETSDSSVKLGACLLGGVEFKQTDSFAWFAEGKVRFVSRMNTLKALAGITYSP